MGAEYEADCREEGKLRQAFAEVLVDHFHPEPYFDANEVSAPVQFVPLE